MIKIKCNEIINKSTTINKSNDDVDEKKDSYEESEYNEDDTSFFTYSNEITQKDIMATPEDMDKTSLNEPESMLFTD